jgi:hypothetical protein
LFPRHDNHERNVEIDIRGEMQIKAELAPESHLGCAIVPCVQMRPAKTIP